MSYQLHPLCSAFPRLQGLDFDDLCQDIKANGLLEPIVLLDGQILDGNNRYRACCQVGVDPRFVEFEGTDPATYVLSKNLHRRHLVPGQNAMIVATVTNWAEAQTVGRPGNGQPVDHFSTVDGRATAAGVSRVTQMRADKVFKADPELAKKVVEGEVSLPKAVKEVEAKAPPKPRKPKPETTVATETASTVTAEQRAPGPVTTAEGDDDDAFGESDPLQMLEDAHKELESLQALVKAAEADDLKAEAMKWRRAYDHAQRQQSDAMESVKRLERELQNLHNRVLRLGKLLGSERDAVKILAQAEALVRAQKVSA